MKNSQGCKSQYALRFPWTGRVKDMSLFDLSEPPAFEIKIM